MAEEKYDAIIVGAGFAGIHHLFLLRNLGLRCKLIEAGSDFGGVWHWNTYPGVRTDSDIPIYEFSLPELWKEWTWTERYPAGKEIRAYFAYVDKKLDLRKDCLFNSLVKQAHWDDQSHIWLVTSHGVDGTYKAAARYLILCTGLHSKSYTPELKGLESFQGVYAHTALWPKEGVEMNGKRVGVIGTGSTGVQIIQELGHHTQHLTIFQRTPNIALPMRQCHANKELQNHFKLVYKEIYQKRSNTTGGFIFDSIERPMMQDSEEEREKTFQMLWDQGGLDIWLASYNDISVNKDSNDIMYAFWRKKVCERVKNPKKRELLVPTVASHPFGCKRPSLEECYYEVCDQDNVDIADISVNPIVEITPKGVKTTEKEFELDVLVLATGFDTHTGAILDIDLRGVNGKTIQDHWKDGVLTYLGMTIDNFPNLFSVYGPQATTALSNAPSCIEVQGSWIAQTINYLRQHGITKFTPTSRAALDYKKHICAMCDCTLFPDVKTWHNGANIPGKKREPYNYMGGLPNYKREIMKEVEDGYPGFEREALQ